MGDMTAGALQTVGRAAAAIRRARAAGFATLCLR